MRTHVIHIDKHGRGRDKALRQVEMMAGSYNLDKRTGKRMRLIAEETIEMLHTIADDFEGDFSSDINDGICEIKIVIDTRMTTNKRHRFLSAAGREKGISKKIHSMIASSFPRKEDKEQLEEVGISYLSARDMNDMNHPDKDEGYVWSLQTYEMSVVDAMVEEKKVDWAEIGQSIIANLADDVKVYVFHDSVEIVVTKRIDESGMPPGEYDLDPELEDLKKVPVPITRFQIKLVQMMYNRLIAKETSSDGVRFKKLRVPSDHSPSGHITVLTYVSDKAVPGEKLPCVLMFHGGAFVLPAMPYHYRMARTIAKEVKCRVIMPMYDLGPKYVAPTSQYEMLEVYKHLQIYGEMSYHIDPKRIVLIGDSAGGTLVASTTLMIRENGLFMPLGQALLYPSLDKRMITESMKKYVDVPIVNAESIREYYKICRVDEYDDKPEYISPIEAKSLEGLPDAYVEVAEYDALHDEGVNYADRLSKAGVNVILNETKGTCHAFDMAKDSAVLKEAMDRRIAFLKSVLE